MKKLALFLLPLAIAACVERDRAEAPQTPQTPEAPAVTPGTTGAAPGRGEGEREREPDVVMPPDPYEVAPPPYGTGAPEPAGDDAMGGGTGNDGANDASAADALDDVEQRTGGVILDESGATGYGGQAPMPEELQEESSDATLERSGNAAPLAPVLPADVVDAGPGMIP